jgi:hypothetical protein
LHCITGVKVDPTAIFHTGRSARTNEGFVPLITLYSPQYCFWFPLLCLYNIAELRAIFQMSQNKWVVYTDTVSQISNLELKEGISYKLGGNIKYYIVISTKHFLHGAYQLQQGLANGELNKIILV